jgi:tuftelin-interacting protein 11
MPNSLRFSDVHLKSSLYSNEWNPRDYGPMIELLESWKFILPDFIVDNILDQLVFPKLKQAVEEWNPRTDRVMINVWILPWKGLMGNVH